MLELFRCRCEHGTAYLPVENMGVSDIVWGMKTLQIKKWMMILQFSAVLLFLSATCVFSQAPDAKMTMTEAVMCEAIENYQPVNSSVVFSISLGEVFCFTNFDPVLEKTVIYHKWYKKDQLIFTMRLTLSPPKWSSFSRVQIRDADKGPWRVEIRDANDALLRTLRFSMVD